MASDGEEEYGGVDGKAAEDGVAVCGVQVYSQ